jgi:hypothetical protein
MEKFLCVLAISYLDRFSWCLSAGRKVPDIFKHRLACLLGIGVGAPSDNQSRFNFPYFPLSPLLYIKTLTDLLLALPGIKDMSEKGESCIPGMLPTRKATPHGQSFFSSFPDSVANGGDLFAGKPNFTSGWVNQPKGCFTHLSSDNTPFHAPVVLNSSDLSSRISRKKKHERPFIFSLTGVAGTFQESTVAGYQLWAGHDSAKEVSCRDTIGEIVHLGPDLRLVTPATAILQSGSDPWGIGQPCYAAGFRQNFTHGYLVALPDDRTQGGGDGAGKGRRLIDDQHLTSVSPPALCAGLSESVRYLTGAHGVVLKQFTRYPGQFQVKAGFKGTLPTLPSETLLSPLLPPGAATTEHKTRLYRSGITSSESHSYRRNTEWISAGVMAYPAGREAFKQILPCREKRQSKDKGFFHVT